MAFAKARTALAQLEEKLRRQLGLAGEVGAQFQPTLTPVIIAADLREAGNASNQGRAFTWSFAGPIGLGFTTYMSLRTEADVFVDQMTLSISAAGLLQAYLTIPGQSPGVAVVTLAGTWADRKLVAGDQVPLTQGVAGARTGVDVSDQNRIVAVLAGGASGAHVVVPLNVMLPAGSALNWSAGAASAVSIRGRIWP